MYVAKANGATKAPKEGQTKGTTHVGQVQGKSIRPVWNSYAHKEDPRGYKGKIGPHLVRENDRPRPKTWLSVQVGLNGPRKHGPNPLDTRKIQRASMEVIHNGKSKLGDSNPRRH